MWGTGGLDTPPLLENLKTIGFLRNTGPDPLENHKASHPACNVGPSLADLRNISKGWTNGVSLEGRSWPTFCCLMGFLMKTGTRLPLARHSGSAHGPTQETDNDKNKINNKIKATSCFVSLSEIISTQEITQETVSQTWE